MTFLEVIALHVASCTVYLYYTDRLVYLYVCSLDREPSTAELSYAFVKKVFVRIIETKTITAKMSSWIKDGSLTRGPRSSDG